MALRPVAVLFGSWLVLAAGACDAGDDVASVPDARPAADAGLADAHPDAAPADAAADAAPDATPPDAAPDADLFVDAQPRPDGGPEGDVDRAVVARAGSLGLVAVGLDGSFPASFDTHEQFVTGYALAPAPARLVAFTVSPQTPSPTHDETQEVLEVGSVDTGASWQVSLPAAPGSTIRSFSWSADGEWLAYERAESVAGHSSIYVVRADGTHHRRLLTDTTGEPRWSPTSHRLVTGRWLPADQGAELVVACAERDCTRSLSEGKAVRQNGVWNPDGQRVAFPADLDVAERYDAYVVDADAGKPLRLSQLDAGAHAAWFSWSPDGEKLTFFALSGSFGAFEDPYVACADGSCLHLLRPTAAGAGVGSTELWSNDSQKVLVSFQPHDSVEFQLYLDCADGSCIDLVVGSPRMRNFRTVWSPRNQWISYLTTSPDDGYASAVSRPDGSDEHVLGGHSQVLPRFDHADRQVVYFDNGSSFSQTHLLRRDAIDGTPLDLATVAQDAELRTVWDSTDRFIVLYRYGALVYCADGSCSRDLGAGFGPNGVDAEHLQLVPAAR